MLDRLQTMRCKDRRRAGSALILTVVLTVLLAIVGILFVMGARLDKMSTSSIDQDKQLQAAADAVVEQISTVLVEDLFGRDPNSPMLSGRGDSTGAIDEYPNRNEADEYYDYPGPDDPWLASLEPEVLDNGTPVYYWRHITDLYGNNFGVPLNPPYYDATEPQDGLYWVCNYTGDPNWPHKFTVAKIIDENSPVGMIEKDAADTSGAPDELAWGGRADADGDGVADSRWVVVPNMMTEKGDLVYAAVRIIDNGGMLNVNTGFKFDPTIPEPNLMDGSSRVQVNIMNLSWRPMLAGVDPAETYDAGSEEDLVVTRGEQVLEQVGAEYDDLWRYRRDVIWPFRDSYRPYRPFDISDELELRYRYLLNQTGVDARVESFAPWEFRHRSFSVPRDVIHGPNDSWIWHVNLGTAFEENADVYDYRHITTTYNCDRVVSPGEAGRPVAKMLNINDVNASPTDIYRALWRAIDSPEPNDISTAAQLAVNIIDRRDDRWGDSPNPTLKSKSIEVEIFDPDNDGLPPYYYGFEVQPYISEIAYRIDDTNPLASDDNSFALELYNPFEIDIPLDDFYILLRGGTVDRTIEFSGENKKITAGGWFVVTNDPNAANDFGIGGLSEEVRLFDAPELIFAEYEVDPDEPLEFRLIPDDGAVEDILLVREVGAGVELYLDKQPLEEAWFDWDQFNDEEVYRERRDGNWHILRQRMDRDARHGGSLGAANGGTWAGFYSFNVPSFRTGFVTVGDVGRILRIGPGTDPNDTMGERFEQAATRPEPEEYVRLDLTNRLYENIFRYITVMDPAEHGQGNNETRVKGRVNVNTAPWFVLAQLPWMDPAVAQAAVAYRDKRQLVPDVVDYYTAGRRAGMWTGPAGSFAVREQPGFANLTELLNVTHDLAGDGGDDYLPAYDIRKLGRDFDSDGRPADLSEWPDLTPRDRAANDFEERDVLFSRISNLSTVRSDVFTAYILVRLGTDGPQKRVMVIFDRSEVTSPEQSPRIVAYWPVPDPR